MTGLNTIISHFNQLCGSNKTLDKSDVEAGRLDKNNQIKEVRILHIKKHGPNDDVAEISYEKNKASYSLQSGE